MLGISFSIGEVDLKLGFDWSQVLKTVDFVGSACHFTLLFEGAAYLSPF